MIIKAMIVTLMPDGKLSTRETTREVELPADPKAAYVTYYDLVSEASARVMLDVAHLLGLTPREAMGLAEGFEDGTVSHLP